MNLEHYIAIGAEFIDMDDTLEHYGVKGMKWGRTTARSKTPTTSRINISTVATGGGANDIKNTLNDIGAKVNRDIFEKQLATVDKHRRARAAQLCDSIVAKNKNTPISAVKNAFKSAGKWIGDKISSLTKKSQPRLKQKLSPKFEASAKSADKFVTQLFRAKKSRKGRSEGLTDSVRKL